MASRTTRRNSFSVEADNDDFNINYYNQAEFKGINTNKNDIAVDQASFADTNNVYVDDNSVLVSRPPIKLYDNRPWIVKEWVFGNYEFRLQKLLMDDEDNRVDYPQEWAEEWEKTNEDPTDSAYQHWHYTFLLSCISHETFAGELPDGSTAFQNIAFNINYSAIGYADVMPDIYAAQIEDKVYFWVAGQFLYDFNCSGILTSTGERMSYFEESTKYLYYPIHKLIINGIESDLETKNFLTETYRRRYQYSPLSSVNFDTLVGRKFTVNLNGDMTQDQTQKLYDITVEQNQRLAMIYPFSELGNNYVIDMAQTPRANVFMRQNIVTKIIEVSYDGRIWHALPTLDNIIGKPMLTRDGMWCVAFTTSGVAKCQLVAQTTEDIAGQVDYFNWTIVPYAQNNIRNNKPLFWTNIDTTFEPHGYFETIDNFVYCFKASSNYTNVPFNITYVYAEWLRGTEDSVCGIYEAIYVPGSGSVVDLVPYDDVKLHFRYVTPTAEDTSVGAFITILNAKNYRYTNSASGPTEETNFITTIFFEYNNEANANTDVVSGNKFFINVNNQNTLFWIYKFGEDEKSVVENGTQINYGDKVIISNIDIYGTQPHDNTRAYKAYEQVIDNNQIYIAKKDVPSYTSISDEYWLNMGYLPMSLTYEGTYETNVGLPNQCLVSVPNLRYRFAVARSNSGKTGAVEPGDNVFFDTTSMRSVSYSAQDLSSLFGQFVPDSEDASNKSWNDVAPLNITRTGTEQINITGDVTIVNAQNAYKIKSVDYLPLLQSVSVDNLVLTFDRFNGPVDYMDIEGEAPIINDGNVTYDIRVATSARFSVDNTYTYINEFHRFTVKSAYENDTDLQTNFRNRACLYINPHTYNYSCKLLSGSDTVLTDNFIWFPELPTANSYQSVYVVDDNIIEFPKNGKLEYIINDENRQLINGDTIVLASQMSGEEGQTLYEFNIHKVSQDFTSLSNEQIRSGGTVAIERFAVTAEDYLVPNSIIGVNATGSHFYKMEALSVEFTEDGAAQWKVTTNNLIRAQLCRLIAYDQQITVPANTDTNPTNQQITIHVNNYPVKPTGWEIGNDWPADWAQYPKPLYPERNADRATIRRWQPGDDLPSGEPIAYYGALNIVRKTQPLGIGSEGIWMLVNGALWTSQPLDGNIVEMDEYAGCDFDENNNMVPRVNYIVPTHSATLNEHFFSFVQDGKNLIEVTSTRRDEEKIFSDKGNDLLLYMPEVNEQVIANKITALHNLSEIAMGLFTEDATYYINAVEQESGGILYSKPIKSKIPFGLRDGNEIITALDGQALIFPTARGLAAMAPEDFVATTERSVSYLSDAIQDLYEDFYSNPTEALEIHGSGSVYYPINIHINTYRYWVLMWREYDKRVFALDTRSGTWWKWETAYPLTIVFVTSRLHLVQYINFNPYTPEGWVLPPQRAPYLGWDCVFCDKEMDYDYQNNGDFPTLENSAITYDDAVIDGALNGDITYTDDGRQQLYYAEPRIKWHIVSQKMYFSAPNNYKKIRQIVLNAKGTKPVSTKLSTKVFRDLTHPEQSTVVEIKINDVRTFVKYVNFMHITNFQYRLENDVNVDTDNQLRLNLLGIKYEVKENIR